MDNLTALMATTMALFFIIWWIEIFIGKWLSRKNGRCPQMGGCRDAQCKWRYWCRKR